MYYFENMDSKARSVRQPSVTHAHGIAQIEIGFSA